jgi:hypothetical protein
MPIKLSNPRNNKNENGSPKKDAHLVKLLA